MSLTCQQLTSADLLNNLWFDALTKRGEDGALDDGMCLKALTRR
jgi:hypothetical protein